MSERETAAGDVAELLRQEWIGMRIMAKQKDGREFEGTVIDETRNTILLETDSGRKRIVKSESMLEFHVNRKSISIPGDMVIKRPEERTKMSLKVMG